MKICVNSSGALHLILHAVWILFKFYRICWILYEHFPVKINSISSNNFRRSWTNCRDEGKKQDGGSYEARERKHGIQRARQIATTAYCYYTAIRQSVCNSINDVLLKNATSFPRWWVDLCLFRSVRCFCFCCMLKRQRDHYVFIALSGRSQWLEQTT